MPILKVDWSLVQTSSLALLGLGLALCLAMILTLRAQMKRLRQSLMIANEQLSERIAILSETLERRKRVDTSQQPAPPAPNLKQLLNATRRSQALRLVRQGATIDTIAATVRVPRSEIDLLVRVEELKAASRGLVL